jgi:pimeloyl-ACP methyl ester carboxylesterase
MAAIDRSEAVIRALGPLGDLPLVVIRRGRGLPDKAVEDSWRAAQEEQATLSSNARLVLAKNAGHVIPYDDPQIVADAVRAVLDAARTRRPIADIGQPAVASR